MRQLDYANMIDINTPISNGYTLPSDGVIYGVIQSVGGTNLGAIKVRASGSGLGRMYNALHLYAPANYGEDSGFSLPLPNGTKVTAIDGWNLNNREFYFIPFK